MSSESEEEALDDLEFERDSEVEDEIDEDILGALEEDLAAEEPSEEASDTDDSDDMSDDDEDEGDDDHLPQVHVPPSAPQDVEPFVPPPPSHHTSKTASPQPESPTMNSPSPEHNRPLSPPALRRLELFKELQWPRSFQVEAICAIPHPVPTHCLASSLCMSHMLTGSDDGYIRNYDIFSAVNGKLYLTAPQRHHCGVMEGLMKAAPLKCWWECPGDLREFGGQPIEDPPLAAPYSILMHSDALWSLAGTEQGHINLFTVRHDPGRLMHVMYGHRGPVSSMSMAHDEKGFFSAGWDGEALQWDLNTGQIVRNYTSHGAQLTAVAVRPLVSDFRGEPYIPPAVPVTMIAPSAAEIIESKGPVPMDIVPPFMDGMIDIGLPDETTMKTEPEFNPPATQDEDAKSDTSFDPLFDDEPEVENNAPVPSTPQQSQTNGTQMALPGTQPQPQPQPQKSTGVIAPKNAPPVLDSVTYTSFSPDVLMTASIDGQIILWDRRVHSPGTGVGRLWMSEKTPPWCVSACWSADGSQIYAGRRNGTIDVWDVRQTGNPSLGTPRILKTLRNPASSGVVSCVVAFPDSRHLACASNDNIRLWNVAEAGEPDLYSGRMRSGVQFKIIPSHHGGFISQMLVDKAGRFLVSASSNRGWFGESTRTIFVHEVKKIWT